MENEDLTNLLAKLRDDFAKTEDGQKIDAKIKDREEKRAEYNETARKARADAKNETYEINKLKKYRYDKEGGYVMKHLESSIKSDDAKASNADTTEQKAKATTKPDSSTDESGSGQSPTGSDDFSLFS